MNVEQIMTKDVATCGPDDTLNEAARIMWERDCGFVPIAESDPTRRVVGIVTDRDLSMAAYTRRPGFGRARRPTTSRRQRRRCAGRRYTDCRWSTTPISFSA